MKKQIVIVDRGWVFVGDVTDTDYGVVITGAKNIHRWGTTKGLGELVNGPLKDTVLNEYGTVTVPTHAVIARIDVVAGSNPVGGW